MSFASAERAYLTPPEPHECPWCEGDPDMTYADCRERAQDAYEDAQIDRADSIRKGEW